MKLISEDYLMHYGVKGMKWGVRHDKPSIGRRYSNWSKNVSNKNYDKASAKIEARRQKRSNENFLRNTKYGKWVDKTSNKQYDKAQRKIEERRVKRMQEHDDFNRMLDVKDKAVKSFNEKAKSLKLTPEQKKTAKKIAIGAAVVAGVGLATYGGVKLSKIRSGNKAAIAKYLDNNPDIANSVLKGGKPYKPIASRVPNLSDPTRLKGGSTLSRGKITTSIKGPTLHTTRSTVNAWSPTHYGQRGSVTKMLERDAIGANGRGRMMTKEQQKYYNKLYKDYIRLYKNNK